MHPLVWLFGCKKCKCLLCIEVHKRRRQMTFLTYMTARRGDRAGAGWQESVFWMRRNDIYLIVLFSESIIDVRSPNVTKQEVQGGVDNRIMCCSPYSLCPTLFSNKLLYFFKRLMFYSKNIHFSFMEFLVGWTLNWVKVSISTLVRQTGVIIKNLYVFLGLGLDATWDAGFRSWSIGSRAFFYGNLSVNFMMR